MSAITLCEAIYALLQSPMTPSAPEGHYFGDYDFKDSRGWTVTIFYDCGDWDYVDSVTAPDGRKIEYPFDQFQGEHGNPLLWDWCNMRERTAR